MRTNGSDNPENVLAASYEEKELFWSIFDILSLQRHTLSKRHIYM